MERHARVGNQPAHLARLAVSHVLPGAASVVSLVTVGYPFDTVKTRLQLQIHPGMIHCLRNVAANDGLLSLYRGASLLSCNLICKMPLELALFETFTKQFQGTHGASFLGGLLGGFTSTLLLNPLSVVMVQMQMAPKIHNSPLAAAAAIWQVRGIKGFYRGLNASMCVQVPYSTLYLGSYGLLRDALPDAVWSPILAGGSASILTWTLLQPFDTLRTMRQATATQSSIDESLVSLVRRTVANSGFRSLWRGFAPVLIRAVPSSGGSMLGYEWTKKMLSSVHDDRDMCI